MRRRWRPGRAVAETVLAAVALFLLRGYGLMAPVPVWVLATLLVGAGALSQLALRRWPAGCSTRQLHYRVAAQMALTTAVVYATGWGPTLAIGYVFIVAATLEMSGSAATGPMLLWSAAGILAGQVAIAAGIAPTLVREPAVHGLGLLATLGMGFGIRVLGATTAEKERAEEGLRSSERRFRSLVQNASDVIAVVDRSGEFTYMSPAAERALGYPPDRYLGKRDFRFVHPEQGDEARRLLEAAIGHPGSTLKTELRVHHRDDEWRWHEVSVTSLLDDPSVEGVVVNFRDVSERKAFEDQLAHLAYHDALTGLANRGAFLTRLEQAVARAQRRDSSLGLLFVDLDRFKLVNDSLGHTLGDELLVEAARRLEACVRAEDTVARFGGDEFTLLLEDVDGPDAAIHVARRVIDSLRAPIWVGERDVFLTGSVGVVVSAGDDLAADLVRQADMAMYQAKEKGGSRWEVFDLQSGHRLVERLELEADLRRAVRSGELTAYYQPEVALADGTIVGFEALARWQHPTRGLLLPGEFVGVAEETDLIVALDHAVLRQACAQARRWQERWEGDERLTISVNLSPRSLSPEETKETVRIVRESGIDPRSLQLEITERVATRDEEPITAALEELRDLGIRLAVDDFGTGYSSLAYLRRLPIDVLKLDRSFIGGLATSAVDTAIVESVITLGHALGLRVTAEGVESFQQIERLRLLGCDTAQGYWFWKPLAPHVAGELVSAPSRPLPARVPSK